MLVDNPEILEEIFSQVKMPICVHCEDEATIRKNTEIYKEQYGEDIPVKFHHLIRSEEACYLSSSKAIELAKKLERDCMFIIFLLQRNGTFRNDIPLKEKKSPLKFCSSPSFYQRRL